MSMKSYTHALSIINGQIYFKNYKTSDSCTLLKALIKKMKLEM